MPIHQFKNTQIVHSLCVKVKPRPLAHSPFYSADVWLLKTEDLTKQEPILNQGLNMKALSCYF